MTSQPRCRLLVRLAAFFTFAVLMSGGTAVFALEALSINPAWVPKNTAPASAVAVIRGIGFDPAATVTFDGVAATVTFIDSRTLSVQVPLSGVGKVARVVVTNPGPVSDDLYPFIYTDKNIYVSSTGSDSNNGSSPASPKRTIRGGVDQASGVTNLVLVTEGRFGDNSVPVPTATVVAGGYNLAFTTRDPDQFVTELDSNKFNFNLRSFGLDAKVVIDGITFMEGFRDGSSGGSVEFVGDQAVLSNSVIVGNQTSSMAGGVYVGFSTAYGGRTSISNNVILGNRSYAGPGGGIVIYPLYTSGNSLEVAISDNYIVGNRSFLSRGGGVAMQTNSFYGYNTLSLKMAGNTIMGNHAKAGAGVDFNLATMTDAVELTFDNNLVADNKATGEGGGLTTAGLGMLRGTLSGSTIASNTAGTGAGAGLTIGPAVSVDPAFMARDLIVWNNISDDSSGPVTAIHSDFGSGGVPGAGNISANPFFVTGLRSRFYLRQNDPNNPASPAIDAGSMGAAPAGNDALTTAADGSPDMGTVDMGMHYAPAPPDSPDPIQVFRVDPPSGDMSGTDWVLIRGKGFDPGARVNFGTPQAVNTIHISHSKILAQPPPRDAIIVDVIVTNPDNSSASVVSGFRYLDNMPPVWQTTSGAQTATSPLDCQRSLIVDWNAATDAMTPPVKYDVHKFLCDPAPAGASPPCLNYLDFIPTAANKVATTSELSYYDTAFSSSGADPKFLYIVRAIDSHNPLNRELNLSKRLGTAGRNTGDTTPPAAVGNTLDVTGGGFIDWAFSRGASSYGLYRRTNAADYANPPAITPFLVLTAANNDLDLDGFVDTQFNDTGVPAVGQCFFYKVTARDVCNIETKNELLP
ncbi:MAG TPA: IPT/TIG domain-containing protein [Candidatus Polarisedimenticolia bacterium]|nr:IPT/TIG domain-containing protein [Candidatus Polarisedimenticolia bacterium]